MTPDRWMPTVGRNLLLLLLPDMIQIWEKGELISAGTVTRSSSYSKKIFTLQKRIIRIMVGAHPRTSCRRLFKKLDILTVPNQYIY
jgi:hypothetical protein